MTVRVGIVGTGFIGRLHAQILKQNQEAAVAAVFDVEPSRSQDLARTLGCDPAASQEDLLERVDAVYITLPNTRHAAAAEAAIRMGRHVFCEKPLATSLQDARRILELAQSSRCVFQVGHNRRFAPVYVELKRVIESGELRPHSAHIKMNRGELKNPPWVSDANLTGGYLYETPVHIFDMVRWLFGEVEELRGLGVSSLYDFPDSFCLLLRFQSGMICTLMSCAHASWAFPYERVEVYGDHAMVETEEMERVRYCPGLGQEILTRDFFQLKTEDKFGYREEDDRFIQAVLGKLPPPVTALDGYRAVEIIDACYRAVETGETVRMGTDR